MMFDVRWPDGTEVSYYSPSLVVEEHLAAGVSYPVADFLDRSRTCMEIADARVRAKYGFGCSQSARTIALITAAAGRFAPTDEVRVESFRR
ncbi:MSMEG_0570 family nitrogen starvation response protein [Pseudonocardia sp. NPDC046786]|uniref:MSMEG_0570 family nitrogen starvation response protein n=1 Tax=Pseudonocardia sp. NPDC046786 TaxID=3155471 RepID=UPI0033F96B74